jgi:hypothetical protein
MSPVIPILTLTLLMLRLVFFVAVFSRHLATGRFHSRPVPPLASS